jgi:hypothetical protein
MFGFGVAVIGMILSSLGITGVDSTVLNGAETASSAS